MILNGETIETLDQLNAAIVGLPVNTQDSLRATFLGLPQPVIPYVPESITPRQAKQALFLNGITAAMVEAAVNELPSPNKELAMIEWEYSTAFLRSNPLVNQIGAVFGKTAAEIDQIWVLGDSL
jgi:hypothetical protein